MTIAAPDVAPLHFRVSWSGQDGESGVRDYDVAYKVGESGAWTPWLTDIAQTQADFVGERDLSYYFRVRATDNVNNESAWVEAGPVTVSAVTILLPRHPARGVAHICTCPAMSPETVHSLRCAD